MGVFALVFPLAHPNVVQERCKSSCISYCIDGLYEVCAVAGCFNRSVAPLLQAILKVQGPMAKRQLVSFVVRFALEGAQDRRIIQIVELILDMLVRENEVRIDGDDQVTSLLNAGP